MGRHAIFQHLWNIWGNLIVGFSTRKPIFTKDLCCMYNSTTSNKVDKSTWSWYTMRKKEEGRAKLCLYRLILNSLLDTFLLTFGKKVRLQRERAGVFLQKISLHKEGTIGDKKGFSCLYHSFFLKAVPHTLLLSLQYFGGFLSCVFHLGQVSQMHNIPKDFHLTSDWVSIPPIICIHVCISSCAMDFRICTYKRSWRKRVLDLQYKLWSQVITSYITSLHYLFHPRHLWSSQYLCYSCRH